MKTAFIKLFVFSIVLFAVSCANDKLPTYKDVDRIYFKWAETLPTSADGAPQIKINLGYDIPMKDDSIINVKVNMMGRLSDIDRPVSVALIPTESSAILGEDIEILPSVIPANLDEGVVRIRLINSEKIATNTVMARIRLVPNDYFHVDFTQSLGSQGGRNALEYDIFFDAKTDMPNLWADPTVGVRLTAYFGKYSNAKLTLICEACGVTRDFFMYDPATEVALDVLNARIPMQVTYGMISQVNRYLNAYKLAHDGQPMLDEFGDEMKTGLPTIM